MKLFLSDKLKNISQRTLFTKMSIVTVIGLVCLACVGLTRILINDRIQRSDDAIGNIRGIYPNKFSNTQLVFKGNDSTGYLENLPSINNFIVDIADSGSKELGRQTIRTYTGTVSYNTSFENIIIPSNKKIDFLKIPLPKGVAKESIIVKEGTSSANLFSLGMLDADYYGEFIKLNEVNFSLNDVLYVSYSIKGIDNILFHQDSLSSHAGTVIVPDKNFRIQPTGFSTFNKEERKITIDFRVENEEDIKIQFLTQSDEINFLDRITKYGILIILCIFAFIFVLDIGIGFSINYLQYLLVGVSLGLFYLLTLSLGEHIGYGLAYLISVIITVFINGWYMTGVTNSSKKGFAIGLFTGLIYILLYFVLKIGGSLNLMVGTIVLYFILLVFMKLSRKNNQTS